VGRQSALQPDQEKVGQVSGGHSIVGGWIREPYCSTLVRKRMLGSANELLRLHADSLPFVLAGALAFVCSPLVDWLTARTHLPRSLFAVGVSALLFAIVVIVGLVAVPPLVGGLKELVTDLGGTVESLVPGIIGPRNVL
jgi:AI-2E family transporter